MQLDKLLEIINEALPSETAMKGDRIGLQLQSGQEEIKRLLITLEITPDVIEEAKKYKTNCIITFHPLIYLPLTTIHNNERVGDLTTNLIKKDIAVISVHTTFDAFIEGTSKIFAEELDLDVVGFLKPDPLAYNSGMGVVARPSSPLSKFELLERVASASASPLRWCNGREKPIEKIAIVGGSGSSFINDALQAGADAFITADISYHQFHQVKGKMMLIDPGHYEMEQYVPAGLAKLLKNVLKNEVEIFINSKVTNPVDYYPSTEEYQQKQNSIMLSRIN